ncbi:MAG TPA: PrsW family glutamic-type intramembrane protease, partial [Longimicrobiaceae bacterium]|nr:PrsW family glutamic-type intramembrane protease [Longimicrobiaceae bacterium]
MPRTPPPRKGLWTAQFWVLIGLLLYTGVVFAAAPLIDGHLDGGTLLAAQAVLAIIPAAAWLVFFYLHDRNEPEPKLYVIAVFLLGAVLARLVAIPLVRNVFAVDQWLYRSEWGLILGSILVVGVVQEFLEYAAVRYTVYGSREFSEPMDGIIYATAAGLGFATMLNVDYVLSNHGVDLRVGIVRIVITALAHASFAGVIGYFMGQAKFRKGSDTWMLVGGVALASVFNGLFFYAQSEVSTQGLDYNPWRGLVLAAAVAAGVFYLLFMLMQRAEGQHFQYEESDRYYLLEDVPVLATAVVLILCGGAVRGHLLHQTVHFASAADGVSVELPAGWVTSQGVDTVVQASNPQSGSAFRTRFAVLRRSVSSQEAARGLAGIATGESIRRAHALPFYRHLSTQNLEVAGRPAVRIDYAYVADPHDALLLSEPLPVVVRGSDTFLLRGSDLYTLRFLADNAVLGRSEASLHRTLASV